MVGIVKTDNFQLPGSYVRDVVARACGLTQKYGMICSRYDPHSGQVLLCPYWHGMRIVGDEHYLGEARTDSQAAEWFATHEGYVTRHYQVLCLAPQAPPAVPGATFPR